MKTLTTVALALFTYIGFAQHAHQNNQKKEAFKNLRHQLTPSEIANLKAKKMTLHLDLSAQQQSEVYNLILEQTTANKAQREAIKAKRESKEKLTKDEFLKQQNQRLDQQIAFKRKMKSLLTPEQYTKFEKMRPKKRKRAKQRRTKQ